MLWSFGDGDYYYYDFSDFDPMEDTGPFAIILGSGTFPPDYDPSNPAWWGMSKIFHTYSITGTFNVTFLLGLDTEYGVVNISDTIEITVVEDYQMDQDYEDISDRFLIDLEAEPVLGYFPLHVEFTVNVSDTIPEDRVYIWSLGNGIVIATTEPNTNYTYMNPGLFEVELVVRDGVGRAFVERMIIDVQGPDSPVPAIFAFGAGGGRLDLTGFVTNQPYDYVTYKWYLNDGFIGEGMHLLTQPIPMGMSIIRLELEDQEGRKGSTSIEFYQSDDSSPVVSFIYQQNFFDPTYYEFYPSVFSGNDPVIYYWDFGDGWQSNEMDPGHFFYEPGEYEVTLTVVDFDSDSDSYTQMIEVLPPEEF